MGDTLEAAWSRIGYRADFSQQPIWRAAKQEPLPASACFDGPNEPVPFVCWEFRLRHIFDERERRRGKAVYGRLSTSEEWQPLEELPRHISVGEFV